MNRTLNSIIEDSNSEHYANITVVNGCENAEVMHEQKKTIDDIEVISKDENLDNSQIGKLASNDSSGFVSVLPSIPGSIQLKSKKKMCSLEEFGKPKSKKVKNLLGDYYSEESEIEVKNSRGRKSKTEDDKKLKNETKKAKKAKIHEAKKEELDFENVIRNKLAEIGMEKTRLREQAKEINQEIAKLDRVEMKYLKALDAIADSGPSDDETPK